MMVLNCVWKLCGSRHCRVIVHLFTFLCVLNIVGDQENHSALKLCEAPFRTSKGSTRGIFNTVLKTDQEQHTRKFWKKWYFVFSKYADNFPV